MISSPRNFTTRQSLACTISELVAPNSLSSADSFGAGEHLGERGETRQVGKTDAAHHACRAVADDVFEIAARAHQVVAVHGVDHRPMPRDEPGGARGTRRAVVNSSWAAVELDFGVLARLIDEMVSASRAIPHPITRSSPVASVIADHPA